MTKSPLATDDNKKRIGITTMKTLFHSYSLSLLATDKLSVSSYKLIYLHMFYSSCTLCLHTMTLHTLSLFLYLSQFKINIVNVICSPVFFSLKVKYLGVLIQGHPYISPPKVHRNVTILVKFFLNTEMN